MSSSPTPEREQRMPIDIKAVIAQSSVRDPATGCLNWTGDVNRQGYATFKGRKVANRLCEAVHGPLVKGQVVRHACDNRRCCEITHLQLGTRRDNSQDMVRRHRGSRKWAKLTDEQVRLVWRLHEEGRSHRELAEQFDVNSQIIGKLLLGRSYRHCRPVTASRPDASVPVPAWLAPLPHSAELVSEGRERLGLRQQDLAQRLDFSSNFISLLENRKSLLPFAACPGLAQALELPVDVFFVRALMEQPRMREFTAWLFGWPEMRVKLEEPVRETLRLLGRASA